MTARQELTVSAMTICLRRVSAAFGLLVLAISAAHAAGAIAVSNCGFGSSVDAASVDEARKEALFRCGLQRDGDCRVVATVRKGCIALVTDTSQGLTCTIKAYSVGPQLPDVINEALKKCESQGGKQCQARVAKCDISG